MEKPGSDRWKDPTNGGSGVVNWTDPKPTTRGRMTTRYRISGGSFGSPEATSTRVWAEKGRGLVWVRRDLWISKSFEPSDCFPVGEGDSWDGTPSELNFAEIFWGEERRKSFAEVVKTTAGRGRGRGPRPRVPKED